MASDNEPAKLLLPYLQRADELQKHEPLVAYYCRLYAMEKGLRIPQAERTKVTNSLLVSLMKQLEKDKKSLELGPEDNLHVEGFALSVFVKADKQDRAGRADLNTAKTFYAASIFFEILSQFGPLQPDLEQKQKYAVWKAADIRKALKEGRKPNPGPPGDDEDLFRPSTTSGGSYSYDGGDTEGARADPDQSQQFHDQSNDQNSMNNIPPSSSQFHEKVNDDRSTYISSQPQFPDSNNSHHFTNVLPSPPPPPPPHPSTGYSSSHDFPPPGRPEDSPYSQPHHHQSYSQDHPPPPAPHNNYPSSHEPSSPYSYPNFQSYPGFVESSLPSAPTHQPSYYQAPPDSSSYAPPPPQSAPPPSTYNTSTAPLKARNGSDSNPNTQTFNYDINYMPPPEKIAEAHKAARFAVGALAFDDVTVAVEHLRKSLELLTNPSTK